MEIRFEEFKDEVNELIEFLTSNTWEFHFTRNPKPEIIRKSYEDHYYSSEGSKTFWVILDQDTKAGIIRVYDLEDDCPVFDIRISSKYKGMGIGTRTVKWLVDYVFTTFPDKTRIEGDTRQDNYAMRTVFHKCGFVREGHFRNAWGDVDGNLHDAIAYGFTKEDWESGKTTPVDWNDFKY